jgi:hypothetical protein
LFSVVIHVVKAAWFTIAANLNPEDLVVHRHQQAAKDAPNRVSEANGAGDDDPAV